MYSQFYLYAFITSLKILCVWGAMKEGMILFWLRRIIDWMIDPLPAKVYLWLRKPLYHCLFCMASFWGILFTINVVSFTWAYGGFLILVGGINYLLQSLIASNEFKEADKDSHEPLKTVICEHCKTENAYWEVACTKCKILL